MSQVPVIRHLFPFLLLNGFLSNPLASNREKEEEGKEIESLSNESLYLRDGSLRDRCVHSLLSFPSDAAIGLLMTLSPVNKGKGCVRQGFVSSSSILCPSSVYLSVFKGRKHD